MKKLAYFTSDNINVVSKNLLDKGEGVGTQKALIAMTSLYATRQSGHPQVTGWLQGKK